MKTYDSWDLNTLREAHAYNQANPDPEFAGAEQWVAEKLAEAEAQRLHPSTSATEKAAALLDQPLDQRSGGSGHSNYNTPAATGASDAQAKFITSLATERGYHADTIVEMLAKVTTRAMASKLIDDLKKQPRVEQVRPATEKQLAFLQDLLGERVHEYTVADTTKLGFDAASAMITALLEAPRTGKSAHGIRHGRYAYQPEGAQAQFYRVGQNGRIYIQAGPAEHPYNGALNEALEAIKADPKTHAALYGHLIGVCGRCSLPLTDETSRAQGLGPVCVNKTDW